MLHAVVSSTQSFASSTAAIGAPFATRSPFDPRQGRHNSHAASPPYFLVPPWVYEPGLNSSGASAYPRTGARSVPRTPRHCEPAPLLEAARRERRRAAALVGARIQPHALQFAKGYAPRGFPCRRTATTVTRPGGLLRLTAPQAPVSAAPLVAVTSSERGRRRTAAAGAGGAKRVTRVPRAPRGTVCAQGCAQTSRKDAISGVSREGPSARASRLRHAHRRRRKRTDVQPTQERALSKSCCQGEHSPHSAGCHDICVVRNTRSGCGIMIVTRPSALHSPAMPRGDPFGFAG